MLAVLLITAFALMDRMLLPEETQRVPDFLRFDWNAGTAGDENPSGQATFGIFGGESRQIYTREIY